MKPELAHWTSRAPDQRRCPRAQAFRFDLRQVEEVAEDGQQSLPDWRTILHARAGRRRGGRPPWPGPVPRTPFNGVRSRGSWWPGRSTSGRWPCASASSASFRSVMSCITPRMRRGSPSGPKVDHLEATQTSAGRDGLGDIPRGAPRRVRPGLPKEHRQWPYRRGGWWRGDAIGRYAVKAEWRARKKVSAGAGAPKAVSGSPFPRWTPAIITAFFQPVAARACSTATSAAEEALAQHQDAADFAGGVAPGAGWSCSQGGAAGFPNQAHPAGLTTGRGDEESEDAAPLLGAGHQFEEVAADGGFSDVRRLRSHSSLTASTRICRSVARRRRRAGPRCARSCTKPVSSAARSSWKTCLRSYPIQGGALRARSQTRASIRSGRSRTALAWRQRSNT